METLNLTYGQHKSPEDGMCLMEAVAFLAGEAHSDQPECASPVLSAFGRSLNDRMGTGAEGDALRAKYLAPLAEKLVGTRSTSEVEQKRAFFLADRAARLFAPLALDSAGLEDEAARLRALDEIVDEKTAQDASSAAARASSSAARASSSSAARAASDAAVWAAAWAASDAAYTAYTATRAAAHAEAWEQAVKVLAEACEITDIGIPY